MAVVQESLLDPLEGRKEPSKELLERSRKVAEGEYYFATDPFLMWVKYRVGKNRQVISDENAESLEKGLAKTANAGILALALVARFPLAISNQHASTRFEKQYFYEYPELAPWPTAEVEIFYQRVLNVTQIRSIADSVIASTNHPTTELV